MNVSMYRNSGDTEGVEVDHKLVLKAITEGRYSKDIQNLRLLLQNGEADRYAESKRSLPSVTFAGTFHKRDMNSIKDYSGMMVIDIDKLNAKQLSSYRGAFTQDPFVYSFFISPGGEGLKVIVKVDSPPDKFLNAFLELEEYFKNTYAIAIDKSGKDISRLCYVSSDGDAYLNEEAKIFPVKYTVTVNTTPRFDERPEDFKGHVISKDASYIFKICEKWTNRKHEYAPGDRNNYIHILACNLNRAGVDVRDAMVLVFNNYSDLPFKEIEKTVLSGYKNKQEHNSVDVYDLDNKPEDTGMTVEEETIYNDTKALMEAGVKKNLIAKLIKTFGIASLSMEEKSISDIMNRAVTEGNDGGTAMETIPLNDALVKAVKMYKSTGGISTLIEEMDEAMGGGMMAGGLYGFIGNGGSFKSIYIQCIAADVAKKGSVSLYLNGEMSELDLLDRMVNKELKINLLSGLKDGSIKEEDIPEIAEQLFQALGGNLFIISTTGWNEETIIATVKDIEKKTGKKVRFIGVDGISQMEDTKNEEIKSAIFNSGQLKSIAKKTNAAVGVLIHTSGGLEDHVRNTSKYVRGGTKVINNMDGMFCTSKLISEEYSDFDQGDIIYKQNMFYARLIDKRRSGNVISKIIQVSRPMDLKPLDIEPSIMEVKIT